jgi:hypothetical protein
MQVRQSKDADVVQLSGELFLKINLIRVHKGRRELYVTFRRREFVKFLIVNTAIQIFSRYDQINVTISK